MRGERAMALAFTDWLSESEFITEQQEVSTLYDLLTEDVEELFASIRLVEVEAGAEAPVMNDEDPDIQTIVNYLQGRREGISDQDYEDAWQKTHRRHFGRIKNYIRNKGASEADAEEIASDAMEFFIFKWMKNPESINIKKSFSALVMQKAKTLYLNMQRDRGRAPSAMSPQGEEDAGTASPLDVGAFNREQNPYAQIQQKEESEAMIWALNQLHVQDPESYWLMWKQYITSDLRSEFPAPPDYRGASGQVGGFSGWRTGHGGGRSEGDILKYLQDEWEYVKALYVPEDRKTPEHRQLLQQRPKDRSQSHYPFVGKRPLFIGQNNEVITKGVLNRAIATAKMKLRNITGSRLGLDPEEVEERLTRGQHTAARWKQLKGGEFETKGGSGGAAARSVQ